MSPRNTSKQCSKCGNVKDELRLSVCVYSGPCCGVSIDRNLNDAIHSSFRTLSRKSGGDLADGFRDIVRYRGGELIGNLSVVRGDTYRVQKDIMTATSSI